MTTEREAAPRLDRLPGRRGGAAPRCSTPPIAAPGGTGRRELVARGVADHARVVGGPGRAPDLGLVDEAVRRRTPGPVPSPRSPPAPSGGAARTGTSRSGTRSPTGPLLE